MSLVEYLNKYFSSGEAGIFEDTPCDLTIHFLDKFGVDVKKEGDLYQFKYNQLCARFSFPITHECRGSILRYDGKWERVAFPYSKFFNWNELGKVAITEKDFAPNLQIIEKIDGCCHEDTIITTEDGPKTIKEICESGYKGRALCCNTLRNKTEYKPIIGHSTKPNIDNWYEITLQNGTSIKLTENHKVWLPKLKCYRQVKDLSEKDMLTIY